MKNRISIVVMTVIAIVFAVNYFAADKKVEEACGEVRLPSEG